MEMSFKKIDFLMSEFDFEDKRVDCLMYQITSKWLKIMDEATIEWLPSAT